MNRIIIEEVTDPIEIDWAKAQHERMRLNSKWLEAHWDDLLPQVLGKFLAVADRVKGCRCIRLRFRGAL